jgi:hypothetical protein
MFLQIYNFMQPEYWILVMPTVLLALYAQYRVRTAYGKWSRVRNASGLTGAEAAREMLRRAGIADVRIERTRGWLSDHYDPRERVLRLSPGVHDGRSVAAVGIAAHEAGHALQHATDYAFLGIRNAIVPLAGIGSWLSMPMIVMGVFFNLTGLFLVGVVVFAALVVFQFITLPVEFNASSRAKEALPQYGVITRTEEIRGVSEVLNAAALTYVAATIQAVATLLYYVMLFAGNRD